MLDSAELTALKAIVLTTDSAELTKEEIALYKEYKPSGFILFKRHCVSKNQVKDLVSSLRETVGVANLPILIDQEGGTVSRLKEPEWKEYPKASIYGELAKKSLHDARAAAYSNYQEIAEALIEMGVTVNCAPVLDYPSKNCHKFLLDRTYADDVDTISKIGITVCEAMLSKGVTPVIKHIPGHGRAEADSHFNMPVTDASLEDLEKEDFATFKNVINSSYGDAVWAMSGHVLFSNIDADNPATFSKKIVEEVIRQKIGFRGVLTTDCLSMRALKGSIEDRIRKSLEAGYDLAMLTNSMLDDGNIVPLSLADRELALKAATNISKISAERIIKAENLRNYYKDKE